MIDRKSLGSITSTSGHESSRAPNGRRIRATPATTSTPSGPSSTKVSPSSAFLSRAISESRSLDVEAFRRGDAQAVLAGHDPAVLVDAGLVDAIEFAGQLGGEDEPDGHGLAVGELVIGGDLDRVGERVAVVEERPSAAFALVGCHDVGLDLDAASDAFVEGQREQVVAREEVVLRHLAETAAHLAVGQRGQCIEVADAPRSGCQNAPTRFLPSGQVHAGLAADRCVDHAEQRGGDVHHRRATVPRGRGEAGDVGDHAAADADHARRGA